MNPEDPKWRPGLGGPARRRGPFASVIAFIIAAALLVAGFMFSLLLLAVVLVVGVSIYGYAWWKTRALRRHLREQMRSQADWEPKQEAPGDVIEGVVLDRDEREKSDKGEPK